MDEKQQKTHLITKVVRHSAAYDVDIEEGDRLISINGKEVKDIFDYQYLTNEEYLTVVVEKPDGEEWELEIEKEYEEDLGLVFENSGLMDDCRSCRNKCVFCFIDQLPKGMRKSLYVKDDDFRMSVLKGNYVTLTNLSDEDVERILFYKLSPINISIHTTDPKLRCQMLNNRFAGKALKLLKKFADAGIEMNGQIVLCKGYNDGEELDRTIEELSHYIPQMKSVSVVPVGLTKFREKLEPLTPFTKEEAEQIVDQITDWQEKLLKQYGTRFVYASDEWYLSADLEIPGASEYEEYPQLENGVGMVRSLESEVNDYLTLRRGDTRTRNVTIATGVLFTPVLERQIRKIQKKFQNVQAKVAPIVNHYFGEQITVTGLLTGKDIIEQLSGRSLGEELLLPDTMLKSGETIFLDDCTVEDVEKALQTKVRIVKSDGKSLVKAIIGEADTAAGRI